MSSPSYSPPSPSLVWSGRLLLQTAARHWPEYLMEAAGLGLFMLSACTFGVILEHPSSSVHQMIAHPLLRRLLMGIAMGLTAIAIVYSPWGKRSGAHLNPSITVTFFRLGKIAPWDAFCYVFSQFVGGITGVAVAILLLGHWVGHPSVHYGVTAPGRYGLGVAFLAEFLISFVLMSVVLWVSNHPRLGRFTGLLAGALVATYIAVEAPLSGMSMNPARTLGSAVWGQFWRGLWIYFTAPPLGMSAAAEGYRRLTDTCKACAKLHHQNSTRCIFCQYHAARVEDYQ